MAADFRSSPRIDTFVLGYCDDTQALLAHLAAEAPWRTASIRVLDPDPRVARALRASGLHAEAVDLRDEGALRAARLEDATTVVVFAARVSGSIDELGVRIRTVCPAAQVLVVPAEAGVAPPALPAASDTTLRVVTSWRFWALVGVTILDGVTFALPLTPLLLVGLALVNRKRLRTAARFFHDLAETR